MLELRQAVDEKKKEIKNKLRESISKDKRYMMNTNNAKEKERLIQNVKHEQSLRKEIGSAMKQLGQV